MLQYSKPVLAGILVALAGAAVWTADRSEAGNGGARCEIVETVNGSMIALAGQIQADAGTTGNYRLKIQGSGPSGGTNISQSGRFTTASDGTAQLGQVMLGNNGGAYDAELEVTIGGGTYSCSETFTGRI